MYDLKITNAKIVDGTGLKAFHSDIGAVSYTHLTLPTSG